MACCWYPLDNITFAPPLGSDVRWFHYHPGLISLSRYQSLRAAHSAPLADFFSGYPDWLRYGDKKSIERDGGVVESFANAISRVCVTPSQFIRRSLGGQRGKLIAHDLIRTVPHEAAGANLRVVFKYVSSDFLSRPESPDAGEAYVFASKDGDKIEDRARVSERVDKYKGWLETVYGISQFSSFSEYLQQCDKVPNPTVPWPCFDEQVYFESGVYFAGGEFGLETWIMKTLGSEAVRLRLDRRAFPNKDYVLGGKYTVTVIVWLPQTLWTSALVRAQDPTKVEAFQSSQRGAYDSATITDAYGEPEDHNLAVPEVINDKFRPGGSELAISVWDKSVPLVDGTDWQLAILHEIETNFRPIQSFAPPSAFDDLTGPGFVLPEQYFSANLPDLESGNTDVPFSERLFHKTEEYLEGLEVPSILPDVETPGAPAVLRGLAPEAQSCLTVYHIALEEGDTLQSIADDCVVRDMRVQPRVEVLAAGRKSDGTRMATVYILKPHYDYFEQFSMDGFLRMRGDGYLMCRGIGGYAPAFPYFWGAWPAMIVRPWMGQIYGVNPMEDYETKQLGVNTSTHVGFGAGLHVGRDRSVTAISQPSAKLEEYIDFPFDVSVQYTTEGGFNSDLSGGAVMHGVISHRLADFRKARIDHIIGLCSIQRSGTTEIYKFDHPKNLGPDKRMGMNGVLWHHRPLPGNLHDFKGTLSDQWLKTDGNIRYPATKYRRYYEELTTSTGNTTNFESQWVRWTLANFLKLYGYL